MYLNTEKNNKKDVKKRLVKIKLKSIFSNIVSGVTVGREKTSFSSYTIIFFVCVKLHHILINPLLPVM